MTRIVRAGGVYNPSNGSAEVAMKAFEVFAIYVPPFLIIGAAIKLLMKRYAVDLPDVQKQGSRPRRRFLLGAWRTDE